MRFLLAALSVLCLVDDNGSQREPVVGHTSQDTLPGLKECLQRELVPRGFAGAVLVGDRDATHFQQSYGQGLTSETKFYIASISKQFAAIAVLKLQEGGRLSVADEISKFLPAVPVDKTHITLHELLTHTSGLPQQYAADGIVDRGAAIRAVLAEPLQSAPGEKFRYTNDGYNLVAAIIEITARQPYEAFLRRELLDPIGLADTGFWGEPTTHGALIAPTMRPIEPTPNWGFRGATGMYSTTTDLYRWTRALLDHRILSSATTNALLQPYVSTSAGDYGYGWFTSATPQGNKLWTAGYEDFGHSGIVTAYPGGRISVVLSSAGEVGGKPARDVANAAIDRALFGPSSQCGSNPIIEALDSTKHLVPYSVSLEVTTYAGRKGVRLLNQPPLGSDTMAVVQGTDLQDGTIDVDVAGKPVAGASTGARGFIGIAFRIGTNPAEYECFYLRPTNGRADDQLRRNHSTQYISAPKFDFDRFRREAPGVYESYVDLIPGAWTHIRIVVRGQSAKLFVNGTSQPVLIVNDVKHPARSGPVGLWIGDETDGYFSNLRIEPEG